MKISIGTGDNLIRWKLVLFLFVWMKFTSASGGSIFFPKCHSEVRIPLDYPLHSPVFQLDTVNLTGNDFGGEFRFGRLQVKKRHSDDQSKEKVLSSKDITRIRDIFAFNDSSGTIFIRNDPRGLSNIDLTTMALSIPLLMKNLEECEIGVRFVENIDDFCDVINYPCFAGSNTTYVIPESVPAGTIFDFLFNPVAQTLCPNRTNHQRYFLSTGNDVVSVDEVSGALTLISSLDAEKNISHNFVVACQVSGASGMHERIMNGTIMIVDVNDNGPYLQPGQATNLYYNVTPSTKLDIRLSVIDFDSKDLNKISIKIKDDYLGLFDIRHDPHQDVFDKIPLKENWRVTLIFVDVIAVKPLSFPGSTYKFNVVFTDVGVNLPKSQNQVVYNIQIFNVTAEIKQLVVSQYSYEVNRSAARFYMVAQPFSVIKEYGFKFLMSSTENHGVFNITPLTGIIYVNNQDRLVHFPRAYLDFNITCFFQNNSSVHQFRINIISDSRDTSSCRQNTNSMCAKETSQSSCLSTCGWGASSGKCQWRDFNKDSKPTTNYGTCSPNLNTCPNKICDELEETYKHICPQDCADNVVGELVRSANDRGVGMAVGNCFCEKRNSCTCFEPSKFGPGDSKNMSARSDMQVGSSTTSFGVVPVKHSDAFNPAELSKEVTCGPSCIMILSFVPFVVLIAFSIIFLYFKNQRQKIKIKNSKHVDVTLSDAPTAYVDDRSLSLVDTQTLSETYCSTKYEYETKWEIQRETIILEQTLGEGEFGKVVKAQAWGINGLQCYSTVAVKMLKSNGSASELMDLMSEFHLLKEVQHPNVIRLLGACTQKDGPLYVVVEYAELGSMKNYLRLCRHTDFDVASQLRTIDNPSYHINSTVLTQHDLLSFGWQIARGMAYLSDMKLVHRDLAARNVLVGIGKIVKISDFGLSRDVYEGDTYFKKSKGRVPVKWMALESLRDHIYTSKSDVWSFGIVLWEIVTLGASPYPGICPERLYQLLNAGYRMEKPENCGDALYRVMRQCWSTNSFERPSFKELTQRFDNMLQDTAMYLDLATFSVNSGNECVSSTYSDSEEPTTPLRNSFIEEPVNYGQISFASSESSIS